MIDYVLNLASQRSLRGPLSLSIFLFRGKEQRWWLWHKATAPRAVVFLVEPSVVASPVRPREKIVMSVF